MLAPLLAVAAAAHAAVAAPSTTVDPCIKIAGVKWAVPADVRACFESFPVNETLRANIVDNVSKVYGGFHTSTNLYLQAPPPFQDDVRVDLQKEFQRIKKQKYPSYFHFHKDIQDVVKLGRDGHASVSNLCFDSVFITYLPFPLVVLQSPLGSIGSIHIAPEASAVAAAEFPDQIDFWKSVKGLGDLASFDGAKVLLIDGLDPWIAVDRNAAVQGGQQSKAQRQNGFFSSYTLGSTGWAYSMGNFASRGLPILDKVTLTVLKKGQIIPTIVTVPYRARLGTGITPWTDGPSFFAGNCLARASTNGVDYYANSASRISLPEPGREKYFAAPVAPQDRFRTQNSESGSELLFDVDLPPRLLPSTPTSGSGAMQFYQLDNTTGVLALGSFSGTYSVLQSGLLSGLLDLKSRGLTKLVVDVTNNGGGYVCIAHWLHRLLAGANPKSEPIAGLYTTLRATPIARAIVDRISKDQADPSNFLLYNAYGWRAKNGTDFPEFYNWLTPGVPRVVNGRDDPFGETIGDECQPFDLEPPAEPIFDPKNIVIVNNGRCSSSCSLFTIAMSVHYNTKSVVVGGKPNTKQQYCGTVGGQSTSYVTVDSQVKTVQLKDHPLAPPDLLAYVSIGITWRLGYSIRDPTQFEEWKDHPATFTYTPTAENVNKPAAVWAAIAKKYLE